MANHMEADNRNLKVKFWDLLAEGGPVQIERWSVDARDALARDPARFVMKLPKGVKPGPQHEENLQREAELARELAGIAASDPIFGKGTQP